VREQAQYKDYPFKAAPCATISHVQAHVSLHHYRHHIISDRKEGQLTLSPLGALK